MAEATVKVHPLANAVTWLVILNVVRISLTSWITASSTYLTNDTWFQPVFMPNSMVCSALATGLALQSLVQEDPGGFTTLFALVFTVLASAFETRAMYEGFLYIVYQPLYNGVVNMLYDRSAGPTRGTAGRETNGSLWHGRLASSFFGMLIDIALALCLLIVYATWRCRVGDRSHVRLDLRKSEDNKMPDENLSYVNDSREQRGIRSLLCGNWYNGSGESGCSRDRGIGHTLALISFVSWFVVLFCMIEISTSIMFFTDGHSAWQSIDSVSAPAVFVASACLLSFPRENHDKGGWKYALDFYSNDKPTPAKNRAYYYYVCVLVAAASAVFVSNVGIAKLVIEIQSAASYADVACGATCFLEQPVYNDLANSTIRTSYTNWNVSADQRTIFVSCAFADHVSELFVTVCVDALFVALVTLGCCARRSSQDDKKVTDEETSLTG
jgi:hypothetical protein